MIGKILIADAEYDDPTVSPVVRQTLLHWAYELTPTDYAKGAKRIRGGKGATYVPRAQLDAVRARSS